MRCSMSFGKKQSANVTLRILGIEPKDKNLENVMRVSMLALAMSLVCFAAPAPAQTVIDVEGQKAVPPPAPERSKPQPPGEIPACGTGQSAGRSAKPIYFHPRQQWISAAR